MSTKKIIILLLAFITITSCNYQYDTNLKKMGNGLKKYLQDKDLDNNTVTKINEIRPLSYIEIPLDKRENPEEIYLCEIYLKGTWSYMNSYRNYNIDDTIKCFFNKQIQFLRTSHQK